ncbi:MAG: PilC/PilY family type IV pilus protein, partial [Pseudomonadota bacterium]
MSSRYAKWLVAALGLAGVANTWAATAGNDVFVGTEDSVVTGNVLINDSANAGTLIVLSVTTPASGGSLSFGPTGNVTWTPPAHVAGDQAFTYQIRENNPLCNLAPPGSSPCYATGNGIFRMTPVADPPNVGAANVTGNEDNAVNLSITAIGVDTDGSQTDSIIISGVPAGASIGGAADLGGGQWAAPIGSAPGLNFTPAADANGTITLSVLGRAVDQIPTYPISTQDGPAINFDVTINAVNDAPVAGAAPTLTTNEDVDGSIDINGVFTDPDIATNGDFLTLTVVANGNPAVTNATLTGTLLNVQVAADQVGSGNVTIEARDAAGLTTTVDVPVDVVAVNDDPVLAAPITDFAVNEDDPDSSVDASTVFTDVDIATSGDVLTITASQVGGDIGVLESLVVTGNDVILDYAADQNGTVDIEIVATDTAGASARDTFTVTVNAVNDAPVAGAPPSIITDEDVNAGVNLSATFTDVDIATNGDVLALAVTAISHPAVLNAVMVGNTLAVQLAPNQFGTGTVSVTATDLAGATDSVVVPVTVNRVNDGPILDNPLARIEVDEDDPDSVLDISAVFFDPDVATNGDSLSYTVTDVLGSGIVGASIVGTDLVVTLAADRNGFEQLDLTATDSDGISETQRVDVVVAPVNDQPFVDSGPPALVITEDLGDSISLAGVFSDIDLFNEGDTLFYSVDSWTNPAIATASMGGEFLSVTVQPNLFGTGVVTVRATDTGGLSATVNVPVTVVEENDPPFVNVVPVVPPVLEDDPALIASPLVVALGSMFGDVDVGTRGDTLTLTVAVDPGSADVFDVTSIVGTDLNVEFKEHQNGAGILEITATDDQGAAVSALINIDVTPVNDAPTRTGFIADVVINEDDLRNHNVGVFEDVDIATNGDSLTYAVVSNTNPLLFPTLSFAGDDIVLQPAENLSGEAEITVSVTDIAGATADDTFKVTVQSVNDMPVANDDFYTMTEDDDAIVLSVLDNDFLQDAPTTLTAVTHTGEFERLDPTLDPEVLVNGTVAIEGNTILYEPTDDFNGTDTFTYTITDADGETSEGTITVEVTAVNDPPQGVSSRNYSVQQDNSLIVSVSGGLLAGAYDVDDSVFDDAGNLPDPSVGVELVTGPGTGTLSIETDGSFTYTPLAGFIGNVSFEYRLYDGALFSDLYTVNVNVLEVSVTVEVIPPGVVVENYALSQTPLEQSGSVPPNVLVLMDDSGSMDWSFLVPGTGDQGRISLDNSPITTNWGTVWTYSYLWGLTDNNYPYNWYGGFILPTEDALDANTYTQDNEYGVWRARNHKHNKLYYNPAVRYDPWPGLDQAGNLMGDAEINSIRMNPLDPDTSTNNRFAMLDDHSYISILVPVWTADGGSVTVYVDNMYVPFYYTTTEDAPLEWDDPHTKVEIRAGSTYPGSQNRTDCLPGDDDPEVCTYEQEIQNFANYMQYHRSREHVTKAALGSVIDRTADLRVGIESINGGSSFPIQDLNDVDVKAGFLEELYEFFPSGGTPLRTALERGSEILGCNYADPETDLDRKHVCPSLPAPENSCQQNFALLFSDGYWNGGDPAVGNADGTEDSEFDGGRYADTYSNTLADVAMYYYENDLFPDVDDAMPITNRDEISVPEGTFEEGDTLHQHVKTYTISFGLTGTIVPETAQEWAVENAFTWPDPVWPAEHKLDDMLHAAMNGRGDFLNAGDPQELLSSMESAFLEFNQASSSASAAAFNSTSVKQEGTLLYRGFFDMRDRTGEMTARVIDEDTQGLLDVEPLWYASDKLDDLTPASRRLLTTDPSTFATIPFKYDELTVAQKDLLSEAQVNYMRGVRTDEIPDGSLRPRPETRGLLGPIVNSSPVFVGAPRAFNRDQAPYPTAAGKLYSEFAKAQESRKALVYVGANDGIMHGFNATTGVEEFGYIPNLIIDETQPHTNKLDDYTSPYYYHNYYVDLTPSLNDVFINNQWRTVLVGGLRSGGKGLFALDVTDPDNQTLL